MRLAASLPQDRERQITIRCAGCDLDAFPNELLVTSNHWETLNFANSHIKHLRMNELNATIANTMRRLYLNNNSITHLDRDSFPTSLTITQLDLSHNLIVNVFGGQIFEKMPTLDHLNLAHNYISHLDRSIFSKLLRLLTLKLNNNRLLDTAFICHLRSHSHVILSHNPIVTVGTAVSSERTAAAALTDCTIGKSPVSLLLVGGLLKSVELSNGDNLKCVNLSTNRLVRFELKEARSLRVLDLSNNKLQVVNVRNSRRLLRMNLAKNNVTGTLNLAVPTSLKDLNLSHNRISNIENDFFAKLPNLQRLKMTHCNLHTINAEAVLPMRVKYLDLSHNRFAEMDMNRFSGLKHLEQLNLNGNWLSDINVEDLKATVKIGISNNMWKCARLRVIIEILNSRRAHAFHERCYAYGCSVHINGIACQVDDYLEDIRAERFNGTQRRVHHNSRPQYAGRADIEQLVNLVQEISDDLGEILRYIEMNRIPESRTGANQSMTYRVRNISERETANVRQTELNDDAVENLSESRSEALEGPQPNTHITFGWVIIVLVLFLGASIWLFRILCNEEN